MDTFGLIFLAATVLFPPFLLVGLVFLWLSDYWSRNEKLFGTLLPLGPFAVGLFYALFTDSWIVPNLAASLGLLVGSVVASFALAFRSGMRDSQLPDLA